MKWIVYADGQVLARSEVSDPRYALLDPVVKRPANKAGSFEFTIHPGHPFFDRLFKMKTEIEVVLNDESIFFGRVLYTQKSMGLAKKVYCEGALAYLLDSIQESHDYDTNVAQYYDMTVADYVDVLLVNHDRMFINDPDNLLAPIDNPGDTQEHGTVMEQFKNILLPAVQAGTITYSDKSKIIFTGNVAAVGAAEVGTSEKFKFEVTGHQKTLDALQGTLVDTIGGFVRVRKENDGYLYLDWLTNFGLPNEQEIKFGYNLLDFDMDESGIEVFTRLYPTGKGYLDGQSSDTPVFYPSEDGSKIIGICETAEEQAALEQKYGVIVRAVEFSDCDGQTVADQQNVLKKLVKRYISRYGVSLPQKITLTAYDLRNSDSSVKQLKLGQAVKVISIPHGIDTRDTVSSEYDGVSANDIEEMPASGKSKSYLCIEINYHLTAPDKNTYVISSEPMGADATPTFSNQHASTARTASGAASTARGASTKAATAMGTSATAMSTAGTAMGKAEEALEATEDLEHVLYSVKINQGTGESEKTTYIQLLAEALGVAIDQDGNPVRDIVGNLAYAYENGEYASGSIRSMVEAKVGKASLISEINAKEAFVPVSNVQVGTTPVKGYYEKVNNTYVETADEKAVANKTYYRRTNEVIKRGLVEATPGEVLIETINQTSGGKIDSSKVQVQPKEVLIQTLNNDSNGQTISGSLIDLSNQGTALIRTINGDNSDKTTIDSSKLDVTGILTAAGLQTRTITGPDGDDTRIDYGKFFQLDATDVDVDGSLFLHSVNVANAVVDFGTVTYENDLAKIPYSSILGLASSSDDDEGESQSSGPTIDIKVGRVDDVQLIDNGDGSYTFKRKGRDDANYTEITFSRAASQELNLSGAWSGTNKFTVTNAGETTPLLIETLKYTTTMSGSADAPTTIDTYASSSKQNRLYIKGSSQGANDGAFKTFIIDFSKAIQEGKDDCGVVAKYDKPLSLPNRYAVPVYGVKTIDGEETSESHGLSVAVHNGSVTAEYKTDNKSSYPKGYYSVIPSVLVDGGVDNNGSVLNNQEVSFSAVKIAASEAYDAGVNSVEATDIVYGELGATVESEPGVFVAPLQTTAKYGDVVLGEFEKNIDVTSAYSAGFVAGGNGQGTQNVVQVYREYANGFNDAVDYVMLPGSGSNETFDIIIPSPISEGTFDEDMPVFQEDRYEYEIGLDIPTGATVGTIWAKRRLGEDSYGTTIARKDVPVVSYIGAVSLGVKPDVIRSSGTYLASSDSLDGYTSVKVELPSGSPGIKSLRVDKETGGNASYTWLNASDYEMFGSNQGLVDYGGYYYITATPESGEPKKIKFRVPSSTETHSISFGNVHGGYSTVNDLKNNSNFSSVPSSNFQEADTVPSSFDKYYGVIASCGSTKKAFYWKTRSNPHPTKVEKARGGLTAVNGGQLTSYQYFVNGSAKSGSGYLYVASESQNLRDLYE